MPVVCRQNVSSYRQITGFPFYLGGKIKEMQPCKNWLEAWNFLPVSKSWPVSIKEELRAPRAHTQRSKIISSAPSWHKSDMISCWQFACVFLVVPLLHKIVWPTWLEDRESIFMHFVKRNTFLSSQTLCVIGSYILVNVSQMHKDCIKWTFYGLLKALWGKCL